MASATISGRILILKFMVVYSLWVAASYECWKYESTCPWLFNGFSFPIFRGMVMPSYCHQNKPS